MTTDDRLPWFPCFPSKWLGAIAGMDPDPGYIYLIVCFRIYETGGPTTDTAKILSRRTGLTPHRVQVALDWLTENGKLTKTDLGFINGFAAEILADQKRVRSKRSNASNKRWGNPQQKQQTGDASALQMESHLDLHLHTQSKKETASNRRGSRLDPKWLPTIEDVTYARKQGLNDREIGREVEKFRNYWRSAAGQKGVKLDWSATWRNWCISTADRLGRKPTHINGSGQKTDPKTFSPDTWKQILKAFQMTNNWNPEHGPAPGKTGCLVPSNLIDPKLI